MIEFLTTLAIGYFIVCGLAVIGSILLIWRITK